MNTSGFGIVITLHARKCLVVADADGQEIWCQLRGKLFEKMKGEAKPVAVGDQVRFAISDRGGTLEEVLPRRNALMRPSGSKRGDFQTIAANIDRMVVMASVKNPPLRWRLIDRFLVAAAVEEFDAHICINKTDLLEEGSSEMEAVREEAALYTSLGYKVYLTSALNGNGVTAVQEVFNQGVSLIAGHSGVGKSTLINRIDPELDLKIGKISQKKDRGKHTTTHVSLLKIRGGGFVVDTPGIREFGIMNISPGDLGHFFPEIAALLPGCQFPNCTHLHEPSCAVLAALEEEKISRQRYDSYLKILEELKK